MRATSASLNLALGLGNVIIAVLSVNNEALSAEMKQGGMTAPLIPCRHLSEKCGRPPDRRPPA